MTILSVTDASLSTLLFEWDSALVRHELRTEKEHISPNIQNINNENCIKLTLILQIKFQKTAIFSQI